MKVDKTKVFIYTFIVLFITVLTFSRIFFDRDISEDEEISQEQLISEWVTQETDGEDVSINFHSQDSLTLTFLPDEGKVFYYQKAKNNIKIYSDNELLFDWDLQLNGDELAVIQGKENLIFYRVN